MQDEEATMVIAVTKIGAPRERIERIAAGFRHAAPAMQQFPGCVGFELWVNDDTLEAISRWESREAIRAYEQSPLFAAHHPGAGGGQQSAPGGQVEYFEGEVIF